jgi:glycosyltransferase involved in cell wall biosynthesis
LPLDTKSPIGMARNAWRLAGVIREERVRIVHARSRAPAWSALWAARRCGVPFVTTYHGAYNEGVPGKRLYNSVMARGDRVIAISRFISALIQARHGTDPGRIRVIHRGADPAVFDPDAVRPDRIVKLSRAWRLEDGVPVVMLPGRLTRWKGQGVLIEALARMARRDAMVVLVGDAQGRDGYAKELEALAHRLGVAERVRVVGHCDDMPAALMLSDVVVNASTDPEAFGRVVVEAQAMGRAVVATDHGGAVETIAHGETGWRVAPGDAGALAAVLDAVLAMPAEAVAALGARARASVLADYTIARMQSKTLDVYEEVL